MEIHYIRITDEVGPIHLQPVVQMVLTGQNTCLEVNLTLIA